MKLQVCWLSVFLFWERDGQWLGLKGFEHLASREDWSAEVHSVRICEHLWYFYKKNSLTRISCHLCCFATNQWYNTHAGVKHGPITKMKFCKIPLSAASLFCVPPVHSCLLHLFWYCRTGIAFGFVKKSNFKGVWRRYCQLYIGR